MNSLPPIDPSSRSVSAPIGYSAGQKTLHWLIALMIFGMIPAGIAMANFLGEGPFTNAVYEFHKSFGLTIFALALLRIVLRLVRGAPPLVSGLPAVQRAAAHVTHYALYILIVLVPLFGWAATSACCAPVNWFYTIPVTLPVEEGMDTARVLFRIHNALAFALTAVVGMHIGAALFHHFVRRDETLLRMLPGKAPSSAELSARKS